MTIPNKLHSWFFNPNAVRVKLRSLYNGECKDREEPRQSLVFGGRPIYRCKPDLEVIFHEMAHLVNIDDARSVSPGWGLIYGTFVDIPGLYSDYEPRTSKMMEREIEVFAIQTKIQEQCGYTVNFSDIAKLMCCGAIAGDRIFLRKMGMPVKLRDEDFQELASLIKSLATTMRIDDIWAEWVRKQGVVEALLLKEKNEINL